MIEELPLPRNRKERRQRGLHGHGIWRLKATHRAVRQRFFLRGLL